MSPKGLTRGNREGRGRAAVSLPHSGHAGSSWPSGTAVPGLDSTSCTDAQMGEDTSGYLGLG